MTSLDGARPEWMADALCAEPEHRGLPWFPEVGQAHGPAVAVCRRCAVRPDCLAYVTAGEDPPGIWGGIWGGTTPGERKRLARSRGGS